MNGVERYVSFLGPPGSGKTTQIRLLEELLGARLTVASVPRLLRGQADLLAALTTHELAELDCLREASSAARDRGELAPTPVDALLLAAVSRLPSLGLKPEVCSQRNPGTTFVALDGCPRGVAQARLFLLSELPERTTVVELRFPDEAAASSLRRQTERETERRGVEAAAARRHVFESKVRVFLSDTTPGLKLLDAAGLLHIVLDATDSAESIHNRICESIGVTPARQLGFGVGP